MKEKYYCLLLNNHNDTVKHHVSNNEKVSVIRGVIQREVKDLYNLEAAFMDLDEKVTINDNSWFVEGSFPIIATRLKDGVMIDAISGNVIIYSEDPNVPCLSYSKAVEAHQVLAKFMLGNLSEESKQIYIHKLVEELACKRAKKTPEYYCLQIKVPEEQKTTVVYAKKENDAMYDIITNTLIEKVEPNVITRNIEYYDIQKANPEFVEMKIKELNYNNEERNLYLKNMKQLVKYEGRKYNNYISINRDRTFDTKVKTKEL